MVKPVVSPKRPAEHRLQIGAAVTWLYVPTGHALQTAAPAALNCPVPHGLAMMDSELLSHAYPAAQAVTGTPHSPRVTAQADVREVMDAIQVGSCPDNWLLHVFRNLGTGTPTQAAQA